jgi:hypothetical protein
MKHLRIAIITIASISFSSAYGQLGGLLKKASDKVTETKNTNSVGGGTYIQPDACISNVKSRCETIINNYHPKFKNNPESINSEGTLWFARKDFEVARWVYSCGKEGYATGGRICEVQAKVDTKYIELKSMMEDAEAKVKEMEKAKGYEFVKCLDNNTIIFKDLKTGKELSANESNKI